jgi:hypothetical protein
LQELLQEIAEEQRKGDGVVHEDESSESGIVLVACKDERSCLQLQECISKSPQQVTCRLSTAVALIYMLAVLFMFHFLREHMLFFLVMQVSFLLVKLTL